MLNKILGLIFIFSLLGCGTQSASTLQGLADNENANNAVVLIGAPYNLAGVPTDIREMTKIFKEDTYNFKFQTVNVNGNASVQQVLDLTKQTVKNADTLFWYFSGHGDRGKLLANDKSFAFKQVADVIKAERNGKPLKRLIVMLDSCYSGSFVDGTSPIIEENGKTITRQEVVDNIMNSLIEKDANLYEQAFVFASSTKNQTSQDDGAANGGAFTYSFRTSLQEFKGSNPNVTIEQWAKDSKERTEKKYKHTPVWKAYPANLVLNEKLFIYE